jgi:hypothetical protein
MSAFVNVVEDSLIINFAIQTFPRSVQISRGNRSQSCVDRSIQVLWHAQRRTGRRPRLPRRCPEARTPWTGVPRARRERQWTISLTPFSSLHGLCRLAAAGPPCHAAAMPRGQASGAVTRPDSLGTVKPSPRRKPIIKPSRVAPRTRTPHRTSFPEHEPPPHAMSAAAIEPPSPLASTADPRLQQLL